MPTSGPLVQFRTVALILLWLCSFIEIKTMWPKNHINKHVLQEKKQRRRERLLEIPVNTSPAKNGRRVMGNLSIREQSEDTKGLFSSFCEIQGKYRSNSKQNTRWWHKGIVFQSRICEIQSKPLLFKASLVPIHSVFFRLINSKELLEFCSQCPVRLFFSCLRWKKSIRNIVGRNCSWSFLETAGVHSEGSGVISY